MTDEVNLPIPPTSAQAAPEPEVKTEAAPEIKPAADEEVRDPNRVYSQEELDRITAKVKKNERYRTKKEIEAYYQGRESAQPKPEPAPAPKPENAAPSRDQYDSYEAFLEAKSDYTARKAAADYRIQYEQEQNQAKAQEAQAKHRSEFHAKLLEKYPDILERSEAIASIQMPEGMADAISESEFGPDVLNHFASNPEDFARISALKPSAAIREIGRLEARFEATQEKPALTVVKTPSRAPAPIKPVSGTAVSGDDEPSHNDPDKWMAWRNRQVQKRKA